MHEVSIVEHLIELCHSHREGRTLNAITVDVGCLTCVDPEALRFCFEAGTEDTELEHVELNISMVPGEGQCQHCGATFEVSELHVPCQCGAFDYEIKGGQVLNLTELEFK